MDETGERRRRLVKRGRAPRIVVSLSPEARKALDRLARRWRVSRAEAIRRAVLSAAEEGE